MIEGDGGAPWRGRDRPEGGMKGIAASTIAGCFALAAFAVAIVAGLSIRNAPHAVLWRALIALVVCYPVGLAVGMIAQQIVVQHVEAHRDAHPDTPPHDEAAEIAVPLDEHGNPTDEEVLMV